MTCRRTATTFTLATPEGISLFVYRWLPGRTARTPAEMGFFSERAGRSKCVGAFEPARTPFDWLSRDPAEVDRYIEDPTLPFYIFSGSHDLVGSNIRQLLEAYHAASSPIRRPVISGVR